MRAFTLFPEIPWRVTYTVLEMPVSHQTLFEKNLNMSGQRQIMIGHDIRTFHQRILTYFEFICPSIDFDDQ